jgi:acyl-CoA synthetase (AMP-forming)/AMP-acid ligase II
MGLEQHTVIDAIRATAARCPQTVALRTAFSTMPYGELVARVDGLAARLLGCGVGPETRVGIHLRRSPEMIVAMLAILGAGAAYVPLDPDYPLARLRYIVEDSQVALVLGEKDTTDILGRPSVDRLDPSEWPHDPPSEPLPTPNSTDPAYVIYTSGSTGTPKGVVIEHAAMTNYLAWCLQALPATGGGVPLFASVSFDHAVTCIYPPLMVGEPLTLLPSIQGGVEPAEIETVIRQHPGVVDAAIVSDDRPGGVELVAAVVVKNMELTEVLLDQHVQAHLPAAMVPSQFIILDQLPVTANGKLDRDAFLLKAKVVHSNAFERSGSLDGDDDIETQLVAKWQEVFGVEAIGSQHCSSTPRFESWLM